MSTTQRLREAAQAFTLGLEKYMGAHINTPEGAEDIRVVMDSIRRVVRLLRVSARASERFVGISGAQLFVLQQLADAGACSIGELAERTLTHQSSVSVVVSRLIERGLVRRRASASDGRRAEVRLSPAGRALLRRSPAMAQAQLIAGLRRLEPPTRASLARGLEALVREIGADTQAPTLFFEDELPSGRRPRTRNHEEA
ncbi:MarR family winged helix-turn-helix transcriptional regulator [Hyalangium rubrum]|uniref:MarR family transcriptional regulator n=1 Tax=Hyalangium rubrum TaxID=3103134 RepID=A0ABU5H3D7_9BACT|nr:MarR family transcriptional regulator [Hyalangium sp. s54d21]MDY7227831.1 MarR family transcriptional regulator [Hyalangium sp. s54d21]